jgi:predicted nucleotidyltransferase
MNIMCFSRIVMTKEYIINELKKFKLKYQQDGVLIIGIFGSFARGDNTKYSDIDIAYKIDHDKFSIKYKDGFSKLLKLDKIKKEISDTFKTKIDFIPDNNKNILKDIIYV